MEVALKTENSPPKLIEPQSKKDVPVVAPAEGSSKAPVGNAPGQQQQPTQQKAKRKHRRGKPKSKNANKPYKKTNWRFQIPRLNYSKCGSAGGSGGCNRREKLQRSRSLVPYNTNKFLMEEHLAEVPSALLTPTGRTRDSSFSMDSEDNYFFSLPEDEEEFLTKEFANVYEKARVERLESLTKQELIEECLQIEDRYSKDQGNQRQQQQNIQRIAQEYMAKIRVLDEKVKELSRENHNLRCQLMRSAAFAAAAAASPPSAAAPIGAACQPTPMDSSSEDSESDSSSSSSSSSSASSSSNDEQRNQQVRRRRSCSSRSSLSEYNGGYIDNNYMHNNGDIEEAGENIDEQPTLNAPQPASPALLGMDNSNQDYERQQLLLDDDHMGDDDIDGDDEYEDIINNDFISNSPTLNGFQEHQGQQELLEQQQQQQQPSVNLSPVVVASAAVDNSRLNAGINDDANNDNPPSIP